MNSVHTRSAAAGFSVLELMAVVAVVAILMVVGLPTFFEAIARNRIVAQTNEFMAAAMLARTEAIRRNGVTGICASNNTAVPATATCGGTWANGWIVWADANGDGAAGAAEALRVGAFDAKDTMTGAVVDIRFNQRGRRILPTTAVVFTIEPTDCVAGRANVARRMTMNVAGSISVAKPNCT